MALNRESRVGCQRCNLRGGESTGEHSDYGDFSGEILRYMADLDERRRPNKGYGICRVLGDKRAVHVEFNQAVAQRGGYVMPSSIIICKRTYNFGKDIRTDG